MQVAEQQQPPRRPMLNIMCHDDNVPLARSNIPLPMADESQFPPVMAGEVTLMLPYLGASVSARL